MPMMGDDMLDSCWQYLQLSERGPSAVNTDGFDRWSRALAAPAPLAAPGPASTPRLDRVARVLGAPASRRSVLGALLAALLAPRLPVAGAVARQTGTCPCPDPPCFLRKWGRDPSVAGQFLGAAGVAVAPDGTVYVVDNDNHRIQYFDPAGKYLGQWGRQGSRAGRRAGQFDSPLGVAVARNGTVYVTDTLNYRIQYFDSTGAFLGEWGSRGSGDGEFATPWGVAAAPDGTVYVVDAGNYRIQYFDSAGTYLGQWGSQGSAAGEFSGPIGVAVAPDGTVYVADTSLMEETNNRIQVFDATGTSLGHRGDVGVPTAVAVAPDGRVYVTDAGYRRIQYFDATGSATSASIPAWTWRWTARSTSRMQTTVSATSMVPGPPWASGAMASWAGAVVARGSSSFRTA